MRVLPRRLRYVCGQRQADTDLAAELEFHREMKQQELEAGGLAATEARFAARRALGSVALAQEPARDVWVPSAK
jgi:hypothetical protein